MALPQQVVEQIGREPNQTQTWSFGILFFSGGILVLAIAVYLGMTFGYDPYLQTQISNTQNQIDNLNNSISPTDQANLINFYSQISNLKTLLQKHLLPSQFFSWLENNTEANVYYQSFSLSSNDKLTMTGYTVSEGDINQQVSIFENSPEVQSAVVSNVSVSPLTGGWTFTITLTMKPSIFLASTPS